MQGVTGLREATRSAPSLLSPYRTADLLLQHLCLTDVISSLSLFFYPPSSPRLGFNAYNFLCLICVAQVGLCNVFCFVLFVFQ